ncbi:unnamed protein product [Withania somnifera]
MKKVRDLELLTKYCEPLSDDDVELQNCPFVYEYDGSPQSSPSVAVSPPSEATGILMLSVPSTDSDDQISAHENEEFETPPEQNNSSQPYFSGSDELKSSTNAGVDTEALNQGNVEAVDLGNDSDDKSHQNHLRFVNRREFDVCDLGEFEEQLRKRYRISEEDLDVKKEAIVIEIDQTQTQEVETEVVESEENFEVDERLIERNAGSSTVKTSERGKAENFEVNEQGLDKNADTSTVKMSERGEEEGDVGEVRENGERGIGDNKELNGVSTGEMDMNGIKDGVLDGDGDAEGERGVVSMNVDENEKLMDGVWAKEMHSNGITTSVGVDGDGDKSVVSMNLDEKEKLKDGVCAKEMHSNGITRSGNVDGGGGGGSVKGKRELPLSMRGGDKNVGSLEDVERRATKSGRFKDLVEVFSMVVGDVSGDDKNDAEFLETAKRRGLSFPQPRWWPPEGFDD